MNFFNKIIFFFVAIVLFTVNIYSQDTILLVSNNCKFYIGDEAIVYVKDASLVNNSNLFYNNGNLIIGKNFVINDTTTGYGYYEIGKDWYNNSLFKNDFSTQVTKSGTVSFKSGDVNDIQYIGGTNVTEFYNLELGGKGILEGTARNKALKNNIIINNNLILNNNILYTDSLSAFVNNSNTQAISRENVMDGGFVSSRKGGGLIRLMAKNDGYIFPVGHRSDTSTRYRPVYLKPETGIPSIYSVRFINNDPTNDSMSLTKLDTTACYANNKYYHEIKKLSGDDKVKITLLYYPDFDGEWDGIARWAAWKDPQQWDNTGDVVYGTNNNFKSVAKEGILIISNETQKEEYFILIAKRPDPVILNGSARICKGEENTIDYWSTGKEGHKFYWEVYGGTIVKGDSTTKDITIAWDTTWLGERNITVKEFSNLPQCISYPTAYKVYIYEKPNSDFIITHDKYSKINPAVAYFPIDSTKIFSYDVLNFICNNNVPNTSYYWDFQDGGYSDQQSPYHTYREIGKYNVMLLAVTDKGCSDTTYKEVEVLEGLFFPNVFTPNKDNYNDKFALRGSGMIEFMLSIYNRWGILIFETNDPYEGWDGKTLAGLDAPAGIYYYVLKAKSVSNKIYDHTGFVTLVR